MVREPRRASTKVGGDPPQGAASITRYECQRVVPAGGRAGGRRRGLHDRMALPRLSQAARTVDLRSPVGRRLIAVAGDRMAKVRRILTARPRRGHFKLRPTLDAVLGRHGNCFSLALITSLRIAPSIRRFVGFRSKAGGPQPARLFAYRVSFVEGFVEHPAIAAAEQQQAKNSGSMRAKTSGKCR